jgi:hypothetical protein
MDVVNEVAVYGNLETSLILVLVLGCPESPDRLKKK